MGLHPQYFPSHLLSFVLFLNSSFILFLPFLRRAVVKLRFIILRFIIWNHSCGLLSCICLLIPIYPNDRPSITSRHFDQQIQVIFNSFRRIRSKLCSGSLATILTYKLLPHFCDRLHHTAIHILILGLGREYQSKGTDIFCNNMDWKVS